MRERPLRVLAAGSVQRRRLAFGLAGVAALAAAFGWLAERWREGVPVFGIAQQKTARIGVLSSASASGDGTWFRDYFFATLAKAGWVEGRNLVVDYRYAEGHLERHAALAAELVALKPDLILAGTQPSAKAVMDATKTVPIVFALVHDPVAAGLAESLARPGKNATGLSSMNADILAKRIELLLQVVPSARRMAILYQPELDISARQAALAEQTLQSRKLTALRVAIGGPETYDASFETLARERPDAVLVVENPSVFTHRADVVRRMTALRLPAMYGFQPFTLSGGLMSYSIDFGDQFQRAAGYAERILRGAKPAELPIEQPVKLELTVNPKAAGSIGVTFPQAVLLNADRVIE